MDEGLDWHKQFLTFRDLVVETQGAGCGEAEEATASVLGFVFRFFFSQAKEFVMSHLTDASRELFKRQPDECFPSLTARYPGVLANYVARDRHAS